MSIQNLKRKLKHELRKLVKSDIKNSELNVKTSSDCQFNAAEIPAAETVVLDSFGFPTTTLEGHPLQCLKPLGHDIMSKQTNYTLLLFYAYVEPEWNSEQHQEALRFAEKAGLEHAMTGRLRIAREGFNGTMTGPSNSVRLFCLAIKRWKPELFSRVDFKLTDNLPKGQLFPSLKVFPVTEIVNYGLAGNQPSLEKGGKHLDASSYHKKMTEPNTVIIDVRNTYEADIGRFQPPENGAEYIDPKMRVSTEFPKWAEDNKDKLKGKQIMMFCTGGIRCERASALLRERGYENPIYQMQGGIHRYLEEFAEDGGYWVGKNYTFDKRFGHGAKKSEVVGKCMSCKNPWERYHGNHRCPACRVPLLICEECQSAGKQFSTVCHLCQEQGVQPTMSNRQKRKLESDASGAERNTCAGCGETFRSRNGLFKHLQETGHQERKAKKALLDR